MSDIKKSPTFQEIILKLQQFWSQKGCVILQPLDLEVGAGTFHPATFLRAIGEQPWRAAYVQPSRRPTDGRYGENPNRGQHYYQFQVVLKPSPDNIQQVGGIPCKPVTGEITYGLERLAMFLQSKDNMYDLVWTTGPQGVVTYGDVFRQNEIEMSAYNFEHADTKKLFELFNYYETEALRLLELNLPLVSYEMVLKASHTFNLLDARQAISVTERQRFILRVRKLAFGVAKMINTSKMT